MCPLSLGAYVKQEADTYLPFCSTEMGEMLDGSNATNREPPAQGLHVPSDLVTELKLP